MYHICIYTYIYIYICDTRAYMYIEMSMYRIVCVCLRTSICRDAVKHVTHMIMMGRVAVVKTFAVTVTMQGYARLEVAVPSCCGSPSNSG